MRAASSGPTRARKRVEATARRSALVNPPQAGLVPGPVPPVSLVTRMADPAKQRVRRMCFGARFLQSGNLLSRESVWSAWRPSCPDACGSPAVESRTSWKSDDESRRNRDRRRSPSQRLAFDAACRTIQPTGPDHFRRSWASRPRASCSVAPSPLPAGSCPSVTPLDRPEKEPSRSTPVLGDGGETGATCLSASRSHLALWLHVGCFASRCWCKRWDRGITLWWGGRSFQHTQ